MCNLYFTVAHSSILEESLRTNKYLRCIDDDDTLKRGNTLRIVHSSISEESLRTNKYLRCIDDDDTIKRGNTLRTVHSSISEESLRTSKYSGTDEIDLNNLSNAYLRFTIQFPEEEDEGQYKCDMNYQDKDGFFQHASQTVVLHHNGK